MQTRYVGGEVVAWGLVSLLVVTALLAAGSSPMSTFTVAALVLLFGAPLFVVLQDQWRGKGSDPITNLAISYGASTIILSLAFTVLPRLGLLKSVWLFGLALCFIVAIQVRRGKLRKNLTGKQRVPQLWLLGVAVPVLSAALIQRWTYPLGDVEQVWLPDDYPLFAGWGRTFSAGGGPLDVIDGFELRYHWLSYALLGGFDRLASTDFLSGPVLVAPVIAWVGLGLGAIAIVRWLTQDTLPIFLAPIAVIFSATIGVLPYSLGGLGRLVASPSHMLSAVWLLTASLVGLQLTSRKTAMATRWGLLTPLGFTLTLGKVTALPAALLFLLPSAIQEFTTQGNRGWLWRFSRGLWRLAPLVAGGGVAFFAFIWGVSGDFAFDAKLRWDEGLSVWAYFVRLMPIGASVFSFLPLLLPSVVMLATRWRQNSLVQGSVLVGAVGLLVSGALELRDGNESWLLLGALALVLPISSVFVTETLRLHTAQGTRGAFFLIVCMAGIAATTTVVISARESVDFLLRPWLLPFVVVVVLLLSALVGLGISFSKESSSLQSMLRWKSIGAVGVSLLFISSISIGLTTRVLDMSAALATSENQANTRTEWLASARDASKTIPDRTRHGYVAVYSQGRAEVTLARWVAEIVQMRNYYVQTDDLVHPIYRPIGAATMESREKAVRNYVESRDVRACRQLEGDGVSLVWITPGLDDANADGESNLEHRWVSVKC